MNKHNHLEKNTCQRVHARHTPVHVTRDRQKFKSSTICKKEKKKGKQSKYIGEQKNYDTILQQVIIKK